MTIVQKEGKKYTRNEGRVKYKIQDIILYHIILPQIFTPFIQVNIYK